MMGKICSILLLAYVLNGLVDATGVPVQRKYKLKLCTQKVVNTYLLESPKTCAAKPRKTKTLRVNVTKPFNHLREQQAFTCRLKETLFECSEGFFGGKACIKVAETFVAIGTAECILMEQTHQSKTGTLVPSRENTLETSNVLTPRYSWYATNSIVVKNSILAYTSVLANIKDGSISHVLLKDLICTTDDQLMTCTEKGWRLVTSKVEKCKKPKTVHNVVMEMFALEGGELLYRVAKMNLIFSKLMRCEDSILSCLSTSTTTTRCTASGYAIQLPEAYSPAVTTSESADLPAKFRVLEAAIASSALASKLEFELLERQLELMFCQNSRATLVALLAAQKTTPSAVLSLLIGRQTQAVFKNGALYELQCQETKAVLQPSLWYKGKVLKYPRFNCYLGSSTVVAQLTDEGYLTQNLVFALHQPEKQAFILQGRMIVFENSTLTNEKPALEKIIIDDELTISASNFTYSEEKILLDLASVARPEEAITSQALHNLITIAKKDYQNRGIDIQPFLKRGHMLHAEALEETLEQKVSAWSIAGKVMSGINHLWTVISIIAVTVICGRLYRTYKRRSASQGEAGIPVEAVQGQK